MAIAHRTRPMPGETENGDGVLALARPEGEWLVVVDGLGHGPKAAEARERCLDAVTAMAPDARVQAIVEAADRAARATRGAALTIVVRRGDQLSAAGVGNIGLRSDLELPFLPTPGIVGQGVRRLRVAEGNVGAGGRIVLHTDGVSSRFALDDLAGLDPEGCVDFLFEHHVGSHDDATALVADLR